MITLGVTGGIGSGKSHICKVLQAMNIPVYDCDSRAKGLYNTDLELKEQMLALFGERVYQNGKLDKAYLASQIFSDKTLLAQVNQLVHPAVRQDIDQWKVEQKTLGHDICAIESAILLPSKDLMERIDRVLVVTAPLPLRITRAVTRDGSNEVDVVARIKSQITQEEMEKHAHYIIYNDEKDHILPQVEQIIADIKGKIN